MMHQDISKIGVVSSMRVFGFYFAVLGLLTGVIISILFLTGLSFAVSGHRAGLAFFGIFSVIALPVIFGIFGGIMGALCAWIYNLTASWVGGFEVQFNK